MAGGVCAGRGDVEDEAVDSHGEEEPSSRMAAVHSALGGGASAAQRRGHGGGRMYGAVASSGRVSHGDRPCGGRGQGAGGRSGGVRARAGCYAMAVAMVGTKAMVLI